MKLLRYLLIAIFFFIWGLNSYKPLTRYLNADKADHDSMISKSSLVPDTVIIINGPGRFKEDTTKNDSTIMMNALRAAKEVKPKKKKKKEPSFRLIGPVTIKYDSLEFGGLIFITPDSIKRQIQIEDSLYIKNQKRRGISRPG